MRWTVFQGMDQLRRAKAALNRAPSVTCDRATLLSAAHEFWAATLEGDLWPLDLQAMTIPMRFRLVRYGSLTETVRRMDEADVRSLCDELRDFTEAAERFTLTATPR